MSALSEAIRQIAPHCSQVYVDGLASTDFAAYGITGPLRESHFLGQFMGETGGGVVLQESGAYTHADRLMAIFGAGHHSAAIQQSEAERLVAMPMPAREKAIFERVYGAGNPHKMAELRNRPGDGWPMRGAGPLQSTGRGSAKRWADKLGIAMKDDQLWMLEPKIVFMPSLYEWQAGSLNAYADRDDGRTIRRIINGGYNGLADCEAWQNKAYAVLRDPNKHQDLPFKEALADPNTAAVQNSLNLLGYMPKLNQDGRYGPATKAAVQWFQKLNNLNVDGIAGPSTLAAINMRFKTTRAALPEAPAA